MEGFQPKRVQSADGSEVLIEPKTEKKADAAPADTQRPAYGTEVTSDTKSEFKARGHTGTEATCQGDEAAEGMEKITKGVVDGACAIERTTAGLGTEIEYYKEIAQKFMDDGSSMTGSLCSNASNRTVLNPRAKQVYQRRQQMIHK